VKLTAQEEYGLRCLIQVARRAPTAECPPVAIRDVAAAEGLSVEYTAKLMRVLRQAELVISERGATGGYRLARPAERIQLLEILRSLDGPIVPPTFCETHRGQQKSCVHSGGCALRPVWHAIDTAVAQVLQGLYLSELMCDERTMRERVAVQAVEG
jgi:Rrf2 family transcriptional regulator, iron-sulfur cluster assembly transcription factor